MSGSCEKLRLLEDHTVIRYMTPASVM